MRRYWLVLLLTVLGVAAGSAYVLWGPLHYTSDATFYANPPVINIGNTVNWPDNTQRALAVVTQRSSLANLVTQYKLYPDKRKRMPMEDVLDAMRRDIRLEQPRDRVIRLSFTYTDARLAWRVASDLTSLFIDECTRERSLRIASTRTLIESALMDGSLPASTPQTLAKAVDQRVREHAIEILARLHINERMDRMKLSDSVAMLDPPVLPSRPDENRTVIVTLSGLAGLLLGLAVHITWRRLSTRTAG